MKLNQQEKLDYIYISLDQALLNKYEFLENC